MRFVLLAVLCVAYLHAAHAAEPTVLEVSVIRADGVTTRITGAKPVMPEGELRLHAVGQAEMILRDRHGVCTIKQIQMGVPVPVLDCAGQPLLVLAKRV